MDASKSLLCRDSRKGMSRKKYVAFDLKGSVYASFQGGFANVIITSIKIKAFLTGSRSNRNYAIHPNNPNVLKLRIKQVLEKIFPKIPVKNG